MYNIRLWLAPVWNGETVSSIAVRIGMQFCEDAGVPLFSILTRFTDKKFAELESPFRLTDRHGDVPFRTEDSPTGLGMKRIFIPERDTDFPTLSYTVRTAPAGSNPVLDLGSEKGGATGSGKTFLPAFFPDDGEPLRCFLVWDMSAMPENAVGAWTWGERESSHTGDGTVLTSAFYAVGAPLDCLRTENFRYYWFHCPELLGTAVDAARIFSCVSAFFHDDCDVSDDRDVSDDGNVHGDRDVGQEPYTIFTRRSEKAIRRPGGTADRRAYMWLYHDPGALDASLKFLFAHEMVHNWILVRDEPYGTCTWYGEGAAEFYSLVLPWRAGIVTAEELTQELNARAADYYENPRRRETNEACGRAFLSDLETTKVPYGRGLFYLLHADASIRKASGGSRTLDDVMSVLREAFPDRGDGESDGDPARESIRFNERWLTEYGRYVGDETAREEFKALRSGAVWDPETDAFRTEDRSPVRAVSTEGTERGTNEPCVTWRFEA